MSAHILAKDLEHRPQRRLAGRVLTATKRSPPEWLPSPVVNFASSMFLELDPNMRLRLQRLTTDSKMEFVWHWLERETRTPFNKRIHPNRATEFAEAFLCGYLHVAMCADSDADYWRNAPRGKEQSQTMCQIRDTAESLIKLLCDPLKYRQFTPWDRLDAAVVSARNGPVMVQELLNKLAANTQERYWSDGRSQRRRKAKKPEINAATAFYPLPARALLGDLPSQLAGVVALAELSISSDSATQSKPPNKTEHLISTSYARKLAHYAQSSGLRARSPGHREPGFHLHQIIAITTNVALNLTGNDQIPPDKIRKLL